MQNTASTKLANASAVASLLSGMALIAHSIIYDRVAGSVGGVGLIISAVLIIGFTQVKRWVSSTTAERRELREATQAMQEERVRYGALQAAIECEQVRLNQDMNKERARIARLLIQEREKLARHFAQERATLAAESFRTGAEMERAGMLRPEANMPANLIQFPRDLPAQQQERQTDRSREHGVVGP